MFTWSWRNILSTNFCKKKAHNYHAMCVTACFLSIRYDLVGVVVHAGVSPRSGHYYSFAKGANQIWHLFDDESVTAVSY